MPETTPRPPLLAALAAALAFALPAPAAAFDPGAMTEDERAAFRAEVRAYLLENPEVLLEAIGVLEERQVAAQAVDDSALIAANAAAIFDNPASWVGGNPDGDVTVVEFVDYNCGFCKRAFPEVMDLVESDGNLRLILKELPILGPDSELVSRFAIAVLQTEGPEAYAEAHEMLMMLPGRAGMPAVMRVGEELGLDMDRIAARMQGPEVSEVIDANRLLAQRLGVNGTPTFILEDRMVRGYLPREAMAEQVAEVRATP
jgi:protein-disulfide isomerase